MCPTSADYSTWYMNCYCVYFGCGPVGSIHYLYYLLHFIPAKTTHKSVKASKLYLRTDIYQGLSKRSHKVSAAILMCAKNNSGSEERQMSINKYNGINCQWIE